MADAGGIAPPVEPPLSASNGYRPSFTVMMVFAGITAAQFLPGPNSSDVRIVHCVALLVVLVASGIAFREHPRLQGAGFIGRFVRWYSVATMTLILFMAVVRLAFPIESFAAAPNSVFRRLVAERLLIPSIVLEGIGLTLLVGSRTSRHSPLVWLTVLLMATILLGPVPGVFR